MDKKNHMVDATGAEQLEKKEDAPEPIDIKNDMASNGAPEAVPEQNLTEQLAAAETQAKDYYDRLLRLSAEFENYKKRTTREMLETVKYANEKLAGDLLAVVDNLERAIESGREHCTPEDPLLKGVHLTLDEILKILARHHVTPIASLGQPFDPTYHQAMMQAEAAEHPPNTVIDELQKGYMINERLLRPALVTVSKNAAEAETNQNDE